jgi:phytoene synthase
VDALAYCREKAAPPGSTGYYAVLMLTPPHCAGVLGLLALKCELEDVVERCSERAVAERKLAWWHEELARVHDATARHPVTICLRAHAPGALSAPDLAVLLSGVHRRIVQLQFRDTDALDASCDHTAGVIGRACARVLDPPGGACGDVLEAVFSAGERVRLLCLPWRAGLPPHTGIALDLLAAANARPDDIDRGGNTPGAQRVRARLLASARDALHRAHSRLRNRRGFAATWLQLARAQWRAIDRGGYVSTGTARAPLPIALLWLAWRHRPRR